MNMPGQKFTESPTPWLAEDIFTGRVALVTGAGSGIGASLANTLASLGCMVALADKQSDAAHHEAGRILSAGGKALALGMDVVKPIEVDAAVSSAVEWGGGLDFVVSCAAVTLSGELSSLPLEDWHAAMNVNFHGPYHVARSAYPHLRGKPGSAVVNIGSVASAGAYPGGGSYAASKAALLILTKQLAVEWATDGIRVNSVSPGTTQTPLLDKVQSEETKKARALKVPLRRIAQPYDIVNAVCFLLSPGASYITGHEIIVDGGITQTLMNGSAAWVTKHGK
ncbi:MAG: SDR family oxidoreductase [Hyphomicrobiales bacterium]|nr:SDR family oxidoreductase [Hyphomicrobiales bacterium]